MTIWEEILCNKCKGPTEDYLTINHIPYVCCLDCYNIQPQTLEVVTAKTRLAEMYGE